MATTRLPLPRQRVTAASGRCEIEVLAYGPRVRPLRAALAYGPCVRPSERDDQTAAQVSVGTLLVPDQPPRNPKLVLPPAGTLPL